MADRELKEATIRQIIRDAVKKLEHQTYLAPVIEGHPVVVDFDMPRAMESQMRNENSYCKTDGKYVYVLTDLAYDTLENQGKTPGAMFDTASADEMMSALAREYSHVVMQHTRQQRYYNDSEDLKKNTFAVACEIEATRAKGVFKDSCVYTEGLTEDTFPCAKGKKRLKQIYQALLDEYGNGIEEAMGDGTPDQDGGQQDQEDSQNPSQNDQEQPSDTQDGSEPIQNPEGSENGSDEPTEQKQGGGLTDEQKEKLKAFASKQRSTDPSEGDDDLLQENSEGLGGLMPGKDGQEPTLDEINQTIWERWKAKQVRKVVRRLKGTIQGKVSRKKRSTYARPSRRMIDDNGLLTRGVAKDREAMPKILVALDCSGSMDVQAVKDIANAIGNIFEDLGRPTKGCKMCLFNHNIADVAPMRKWKKFVETYKPWGGTDFDNVADLANKLDVDIVIEVGDGFCYFENDRVAEKFFTAGRKWYDATIIDPSDLEYLQHNLRTDEQNGFHREVLYLNEKTAVAVEREKLSLNTEEELRVHSSKKFRNWQARR